IYTRSADWCCDHVHSCVCVVSDFYVFCFFFFSSRRRHTRSKRDWSSDVCSSDLRVEFGAKLSVSLVSGYAFLDVLSWDPYHEGTRLRDSVEKYKERHGYYPEAVLVDTIYRTRENRKFCKERGIRMSGPKL